jgi:hypothetical protein
MKVQELIALLQDMNPEADVHIAYNYGDHWRTVVAPEVRSVTETYVIESNYHSMPKVVDDESEVDDEATEVVVISNIRIDQ